MSFSLAASTSAPPSTDSAQAMNNNGKKITAMPHKALVSSGRASSNQSFGGSRMQGMVAE